MKIARHVQNRLGMRLAERHRPRQSRQYRAQIKSAESVGSFRQIQARVLALPDRVVPWGLPLVVAAADGALEVAQQHVDPACVRGLTGFSWNAKAFQPRDYPANPGTACRKPQMRPSSRPIASCVRGSKPCWHHHWTTCVKTPLLSRWNLNASAR